MTSGSEYFKRNKLKINTFTKKTTITITLKKSVDKWPAAFAILKLANDQVKASMIYDSKVTNTHEQNGLKINCNVEITLEKNSTYALYYVAAGNLQINNLKLNNTVLSKEAKLDNRGWYSNQYYQTGNKSEKFSAYNSTGGGDGGNPTNNQTVVIAIKVS